MDFDPLELARQLTLVEHELFCRVQAKEMLDEAWLSKDKLRLAPTLTALAQWSTRMSHWVITEILMVDTPKGRAAVYERFVAIAKVRTLGAQQRAWSGRADSADAVVRVRPTQALESLRNFNGIVEIMTALVSSPIYRLRFTLQVRPSWVRSRDSVSHGLTDRPVPASATPARRSTTRCASRPRSS